MAVAAFFDLDRTVTSGASTLWFGKAALAHGYYPRRQLARDAWKAFWFRMRGDAGQDTGGLRDHILTAVEGWRRSDMDVLIPEVLAPILERVYPQSWERILEHERAGVRTYLCSASPVEIVGAVARALQMSGGAIATVAAVDGDGKYTGELEGPFCYAEGKAEAMRAEAARSDIDLSRSWAYSDSSSDVAMLDSVGHAVAVNPDSKLRKIAEERGWDIERFEPRHGLRVVVASTSVVGIGAIATGAVFGVRALRRRS